jgi:predicted porin
MKKTLIALAAVASTAAFAQSSVTIDGAVDLGIVKKTGASATLDAANGASQIRFLGTEDLGGGLKAHFTLAQRFSPESGLNDGTTAATQRPTFQGESTVGLSGGFGSVKLGRALTAFQGPVNTTDPWGTLQQGSLAVLTTAYATDINNVAGSGSGLGRTDGIFYTSPNFSGFSAAVTLGLKNSNSSGTPTVGAKNLMSLWASYASGPLYVGGGMEQNRSDDQIMAILGTYNLGFMTVGAGYSSLDPAAAAVDRTSWNLMAVAPMGAVTIKAAYGQSKVSGVAADTKKLGLGVDYALSKRTKIYTSYGRNSVTKVTGYDVGVRHTF